MDTKPMSQVLKTAPEVTSLSATDRVLVTDANGEPKRVSITALAAAIEAVGSMMRCVSLNKVDIDANSLTQPNTIYTSVGDMASWDSSLKWLNFPTWRPDGGFTLWNVKEGYYFKQFYTYYGDSTIYVRLSKHKSGASVWTDWQRMIPVAFEQPALMSGGGVNRYSSTLYAILQKGGLRNGDETADQRTAEGEDDGCDGGERYSRESGHFSCDWLVSYHYKHCLSESPTFHKLDLWDGGSFQSKQSRVSQIILSTRNCSKSGFFGRRIRELDGIEHRLALGKEVAA